MGEQIGVKRSRISFFAWDDGGFLPSVLSGRRGASGRLLDEGHVLGKMLPRAIFPLATFN
jgi:hypothetical protein